MNERPSLLIDTFKPQTVFDSTSLSHRDVPRTPQSPPTDPMRLATRLASWREHAERLETEHIELQTAYARVLAERDAALRVCVNRDDEYAAALASQQYDRLSSLQP